MVGPRMSSISTGGQRAAVDAAAQAQPRQRDRRSRAAAWRCPRAAPRRACSARRSRHRRARRSGGRPRACRRRRAPRRRRSGRCRRAARTPPSADRRTRAPRRARSRSHSSWRSPWPRPECRTATTSPNRAWNRPTVCGVSAISGTSTIAPRPAASVSCTACRYTSVLPEPVTPWSRNRPSAAVRAAASASGRVERGLLLGGQRRRPGVAPPRRSPDRHRAGASARAIATRPRPSRRRSIGVPSQPRPRRRRARAPRALARWRSVSGPSPARARARPPSVSSATSTRSRPDPAGGARRQHERERPRRRRAVLRPRSSPPARPGRRGRRREDGVGLGEPLGRELGLRRRARARPRASRRRRTAPQQRADADVGLLGAQPVVERPAHRARQRERLDAGDHGGLADGAACIGQRRVKSGQDDGRSSRPDHAGAVPGRAALTARHDPAMCDSLLGEVGRRDHMFTWLRAPGAGRRRMAPGRRVLPSRSAGRHVPLGVRAARLLYEELIPAHGLGLLTLDPAALGTDAGGRRGRSPVLGPDQPAPREVAPRPWALAAVATRGRVAVPARPAALPQAPQAPQPRQLARGRAAARSAG